MKKGSVILPVMGSLLLVVVLAIGFLIYKTEYARTLIGTYDNGNRQLTISEIGEPGFPFGSSQCRLVLNEGGRLADSMDFSVANDGKRLSEEAFEVSWLANGVSVTVHGEEQEDRTYVLYSASEGIQMLTQPQLLHANFIEWVRDGFRAEVCDPMDNTVFPDGAQLTVIFTEETYFIDLDGSVTYYPGKSLFEPSISRKLKWVEGMVIEIEIIACEDYVKDNGFRNRVIGRRIENVDVIVVDLD
ncbi:MAG: hypothetical protein IJM79_03755 [Erysipelotrichaceae bacterium]|nr:hypothetical protein [Erysipelotrichaceae bacterium]